MENCKKGNHSLIDIYTNGYVDHERIVVRWCTNCGAVVVDMDYDGRTQPGAIVKMKFPKQVYNVNKPS